MATDNENLRKTSMRDLDDYDDMEDGREESYGLHDGVAYGGNHDEEKRKKIIQ